MLASRPSLYPDTVDEIRSLLVELTRHFTPSFWSLFVWVYEHPGLCFERGFSTTWFGARIAEGIPLPVETGDEHGAAVLFAAWLVTRDQRRLIPSWSGVAEGLAEATLAELIRATEKLDRIVDVEGGKQEFHRPIMFVAQRQDVGPHGPILALLQNRTGGLRRRSLIRHSDSPLGFITDQPGGQTRHLSSRAQLLSSRRFRTG